MKIEIKFRGKSIHNNKWVYGYFYENKMLYGEHATIISTDEVDNDWDGKEQLHYHVDRNTVGQFKCKSFSVRQENKNADRRIGLN